MDVNDKLSIKEVLFAATVPTCLGTLIVGLGLGVLTVFAMNDALIVLIGLALFLGFSWIIGLGVMVWIDDRTHILSKIEDKFRKGKGN
jgi:hypothetical protein